MFIDVRFRMTKFLHQIQNARVSQKQMVIGFFERRVLDLKSARESAEFGRAFDERDGIIFVRRKAQRRREAGEAAADNQDFFQRAHPAVLRKKNRRFTLKSFTCRVFFLAG